MNQGKLSINETKVVGQLQVCVTKALSFRNTYT